MILCYFNGLTRDEAADIGVDVVIAARAVQVARRELELGAARLPFLLDHAREAGVEVAQEPAPGWTAGGARIAIARIPHLSRRSMGWS